MRQTASQPYTLGTAPIRRRTQRMYRQTKKALEISERWRSLPTSLTPTHGSTLMDSRATAPSKSAASTMGIIQTSSFFSIAPALKRKASVSPCGVSSKAKPDDELGPSHVEHATHALAGVYHL